MAWLGRRQKWRDCEVGMALTVFLLLPLYVLSLTTTAPAQQLKFWVWHTSVEKEQSKPDPRHREPHFQVNHSLQMICKYADYDGTDYCALRGETNLTVTPVEVGGRENQLLVLQNLVIVEKTKCHLIIELQNVTTAFQGRYYCNDSLNPGQFTYRDFHVGEAPVAPRNLRVVYHPGANLSLLLDPVRTGQDLNDPDTTWNVQYKWMQLDNCSGEASDAHCWQLTPEGQCQACVVPLQYEECGQYTKGFLAMLVNFNWTVKNKFGSVVGKTPADVMMTDWVKPGPPSRLEVANESTTSSALAVTVFVPAHMDQAHINLMKGANRLQLQYSVEILSARDQILLSPDGARFMQEYDFVPNLQDEEEALRDSLLQSNFSGLSELLMWNSSAAVCNPALPLTVGISPLPFAGYHYNVLFVAKGHYWGTPVHFEREKAVTKDGVPLEGPGLHHNFAYCRPPDTNGCVTCIVYFKAIPQTKRGGEVIQHRLDVNLTTNLTNDLPQACANRNGVTITTRGSNNTSNTFRVPQLALGGVYEVRVQASTSAGHSPVTSGTLRVASSPDFAPWNVVVESKDPSYKVEWKPGKTRAGNSAVFYVHYCYTLPLQLDSSTGVSTNGSVEPPLPLNCVTNMVTKTMARDSHPSFTFRLDHTNKGLTPTFFVSAVGPQRVGSGLQAVDCFYASGTYPEAVDPITVQQVEGDPSSLLIRFKLPCGPDQSYRYGRPYSYAVGKAPPDSDCEADCGKVMTGRADVTQRQINVSLRDEVTFTLSHLQLDSRYCVGVNVMDQSEILRKSSWRCVVASTGNERSLSGWVVALMVVISVLFLLFTSIIVYCNIRARCHKLTEKFKDSYSEPEEAQGSAVSNGKWEGVDNQMFHGDSSPPPPPLSNQVEDGEVHFQDETPQPKNSASAVEDWPEEREPATSSTQSTLTHSQSSGEDEDSQHAPMSHRDDDGEDTASLTASTHSQPTHDATVHPDVSGGETSERPYPVLQPLDTGGELSDRYSSVPSGGHNSHQIELAVMDAKRPDPEEEDGEGEEGSVSGSEEEEGSEQAEDVGGREEAMEQAAVSIGSVNQSPGVAHRGVAGRYSLSPLTRPTGVPPDADPSTAIDIDDILLSALGPDTAKPGSPLMVSSTLSVVSSPAALSIRREEPVDPAGWAEPAMPPVLSHPQLSTQTASQSGDVEDSGTRMADSPASCHPAPSSSDMNIDAILQSAEESRPGAFPLSHSTVVVGGSGDSENLSPSHPRPQQPFHRDSFPPVNGIDVGRDDGDFSDSRTVPQLPLAQSPAQTPTTLPYFQDGISALSPATESSPQMAGSDSLDLDIILSAASNCPWKQPELTPSPDVERSRKAFQDKRYDNSLHLARQESGIHMDKGLGSSTESGLEQLLMVLSGSGFSPSNGSSEDEKSLLSPTDSSPSSSEGGEEESLLESSFLPPTDKTSRAGKVTVADGPSLTTTRL